MSAETDLITTLRGSAALLAATKGIFLNAADEATPLPYLVVTATHDSELLLTGDVDRDHVTFTIACWAVGAGIAETVADMVRDVVNLNDDYALLARVGGFDEQTANDAAVITVDRWV